MNKYFVGLISICWFFICLEAEGQTWEKQRDLPHLTFVDPDFTTILDSIVLVEKGCTYYSCNLLFSVSTEKSDNKTFITIESLKDLNVIMNLNPSGYFYHRNHLFILNSNFPHELFSECKTIGTFKYIDYAEVNFTIHEAKDKWGAMLLNDHSFSFWQYCYDKGKFIQIKKVYSCQ